MTAWTFDELGDRFVAYATPNVSSGTFQWPDDFPVGSQQGGELSIEIVGLAVVLQTSGTAGNRRAVIGWRAFFPLLENTFRMQWISAFAPQPANNTNRYEFSLGAAGASALSFGIEHLPSGIVLTTGTRFEFSINNGQVGDQFTYLAVRGHKLLV